MESTSADWTGTGSGCHHPLKLRKAQYAPRRCVLPQIENFFYCINFLVMAPKGPDFSTAYPFFGGMPGNKGKTAGVQF